MELTPVTHTLPLTSISRKRLMPYRGRILVHESQHVKATDTIGTCLLPGNHFRLDLCTALGIKLIPKCMECVERKTGDPFQKGDIIAQTKGMMKRIVRAPSAGFVVNIENGVILLEVEKGTFELKAGYTGIVHEIIPETGAIIESSGALIQGVWGNDRISQGILASSNQNPAAEFSRSSLDVSMRGSIWLGTYCLQQDALQAAVDLPLRGLILSSMSSELIPFAKQLPFPVILLEGFGMVSLNSLAYKLLTTHDKREICINASPWDRMLGNRPEIIVPLPTEGKPTDDIVEMEINQTIHVSTIPYLGKIGTIKRIQSAADLMPNQIRAPFIEAQTESGETLDIPFQNFEVIG
jgi:hypothetical protein